MTLRPCRPVPTAAAAARGDPAQRRSTRPATAKRGGAWRSALLLVVTWGSVRVSTVFREGSARAQAAPANAAPTTSSKSNAVSLWQDKAGVLDDRSHSDCHRCPRNGVIVLVGPAQHPRGRAALFDGAVRFEESRMRNSMSRSAMESIASSTSSRPVVKVWMSGLSSGVIRTLRRRLIVAWVSSSPSCSARVIWLVNASPSLGRSKICLSRPAARTSIGIIERRSPGDKALTGIGRTDQS